MQKINKSTSSRMNKEDENKAFVTFPIRYPLGKKQSRGIKKKKATTQVCITENLMLHFNKCLHSKEKCM